MIFLPDFTEILGALADATRLRILALLEEEELAVHELLEVLGGSQSALSSHLARLKRLGLVLHRREGTRSLYRLGEGPQGEGARGAWKALRGALVEEPVLAADRERLARARAARRGGAWADRAAGSLHRQYLPGRTFESVAFCLAGLVSLGDAVDLGSGDGALVALLAPQARRLLCVDLSARMVQAGRRRAREVGARNVLFVRGDMARPPAPAGRADTVLLLQSLQYADRPADALRAAAGLLREGGRCVVLTLERHADRELREQYGHLHAGFGTEQLARWLQEAGLEVRRLEAAALEPRAPHLRTVLAVAEQGRSAQPS